MLGRKGGKELNCKDDERRWIITMRPKYCTVVLEEGSYRKHWAPSSRNLISGGLEA